MARSKESDDPQLPTTALQHRFDPSPAATGAFVLEAVEGPGRGARLRLDGSQPSRSLVGVSSACDLHLADREASRRHAALELSGERLRVTDLGSTNGTWVNGLRVTDVYL